MDTLFLFKYTSCNVQKSVLGWVHLLPIHKHAVAGIRVGHEAGVLKEAKTPYLRIRAVVWQTDTVIGHFITPKSAAQVSALIRPSSPSPFSF